MAAPLRIRGPSTTDLIRSARSSAEKAASVDSYVQRLIKLIPAEVVSAYLVGREIAQAAPNEYGEEWAAWCLLATIVFRSVMTFEKPEDRNPRIRDYLIGVEWPAVLIASVSFSIWVFTLGDSYPAPLPSLKEWQAALLLLLWTPFIPLIYKGSSSSSSKRRTPPAPASAAPVKGKRGPPLEGAIASTGTQSVGLAGPEATAPMTVPRLPQRIRRSRIGTEDRRRVSDASTAPFEQIILLHALAGEETVARKAGTAWFLKPNVIVTAGHVVYDPAAFGSDGFAGRVFGWPGYNRGGGSPRFEANKIHVPSQYAERLNNEFDVAVILLETSYEGFGFPLSSAVAPARIMVAGFPSDMGGGTEMFHCSGDVVAVEEGFLLHDADTSPGQSGAPILTNLGDWNVTGIHIDGKHHSDHLTREANLGIAFHPEVERWLAQFQ